MAGHVRGWWIKLYNSRNLLDCDPLPGLPGLLEIRGIMCNVGRKLIKFASICSFHRLATGVMLESDSSAEHKMRLT